MWSKVKEGLGLILLALGGVALFLLFAATNTRGRDAFERLKKEREIIRAKRELRDLRIREGAGRAREQVQREYADELKHLEAKTRNRIEELKNDPEQLLDALLRLS